MKHISIWVMGLALALSLCPHLAAAQQIVKLCLPVTSTTSGVTVQSCWDVGAANPLPVAIGGVVDGCQSAAKVNVPISQTTNTKLISAATGKKNYICSIAVVGADAENISVVEGTGSTCGSSTAAVVGSTTASAGMNFQAGAGFVAGTGGNAVIVGTGAALDLCLFQSGSGRVSGFLTYVQAP